jgi:hypothetical protein
MRAISFLSWSVFFTCAFSLAYGADSTCDAVPPEQSSLGYRFWSDSPRCEGLYVSPVSGSAGVSLVSLTMGAIEYKQSDEFLEIALVQPAKDVTHIRAVGIPLELFYRMDANIAAGRGSLRLPLGDVIAPAHIRSSDLGIYGARTLPGGIKGYVPLSVKSATSVAQPGIVAILRAGSDINDVEWRMYGNGLAATPLQAISIGPGLVGQGASFRIDLGPHPALSTFKLEISYYAAGVPRSDRFDVLSP